MVVRLALAGVGVEPGVVLALERPQPLAERLGIEPGLGDRRRVLDGVHRIADRVRVGSWLPPA